jgi:hypothetical protein
MMRKENNTFLLVSIIYLFFNSFLLPEGLLFTTLLTPFFFIHLMKHKGIQVYFAFLIVSCIMAAIQLPAVDYFKEYVKSFILLQTVAIFTINAYYVVRKEANLAATFKVLGSVNMVLLGISILFLFIPLLKPWLWYLVLMSEGLPIIPRLKMLTYEASYYSLIIVPLFVYYFLKRTLLSGKTGILLITLGLSLILSLSFGVLIALMISFVFLYLLNLNELGRKINLNYLSAGIIVIIIGIAAVYWLYPHNVVFDRFRNIYAGKDTSAKGRTSDSFVLAWNIAKMKSLYFGIGLGQLKLIGRDLVIQFYGYSNIPPVTRIPNAVAETLNIYGLTGIVFRFGIIVYLFFKTKVWNNYYRLVLFIFIFIYQFTGSFLFNVAEYVVWVLAFSSNIFSGFDRRHFMKEGKYETKP